MARATRPFSAFEWMVAWRYLRAKRQTSFVSVISGFSLVGIGLGVATLIIVMSVMNGFRTELLGRILGLNGDMTVQSLAGGIPDYDAVTNRLRLIPGVTEATPIVEDRVMANADGMSFGALVRGIRAADLRRLTTVSSTLSRGALDGYDDGQSVILGALLAERLGLTENGKLRPGATVTLIAPKGAVTPFGTTPRVKTYRVSGIFEVGMSQYDQIFIFMPLAEAQLFFGLGDTVAGIELMVANADDVSHWRQPVQRAAGSLARISDWQQRDSSLFDTLMVERNVMFMILTMIILVAALNIISGLIMLVKDKGGDIAILRTMGASQGSIMRVFFIAGASIGIIGTFSGVLLGIAFSANIEAIRQFLSRLTGTTLFDPAIYFLSRMPSQIEPGDVLAVVLMSLSLSFLATLYPSWRAAKLDPVEALRYE